MPVTIPDQDPGFVVIGRISGLYGVRGWFKVFSHTSPVENILGYSPWYLRQQGAWVAHTPQTGRGQGKGIVAKLAGCDDRDQAAALLGQDIAIRRDQLPTPEPGSYYWADLEGLQVVTTAGVELGRVVYLFETGANDVMVVQGERERLIPFIPQVVLEVDPPHGRIKVDWDPDF
jgi:16S rRNA processing protein RimM